MAHSLSQDDDLTVDDAPSIAPNWTEAGGTGMFDEVHLSSDMEGIKLENPDSEPSLKPRGPPAPGYQIKEEPGGFSPCIYGNRDPRSELQHGVFEPLVSGYEPVRPFQSISADASRDISMDNVSFVHPSVEIAPFMQGQNSIGKYGNVSFNAVQPGSVVYIKPEMQPFTGIHGQGHSQGQGHRMPPGYPLQQNWGQVQNLAAGATSNVGYQGNRVNCTPHPGVQSMSVTPQQPRVEIDENGESALHWLSMIEDSHQCQTIFESRKREFISCINLMNKRQQTPLFLTVQQGNLKLTEVLLLHGANPNLEGTIRVERDTYIWRAPLHLAASDGDSSIHILSKLLSCRATNIDARTTGDRLTALHLALKRHRDYRDCKQTIFMLLKAGANIKINEERSSRSVLMLAVETRDVDLVRDFLNFLDTERCRQMLQEQMRSGDTCLHVAAGLSQISSRDKELLLRLLVTKGANGNVPNNGKEFPRDYARTEWDRVRTM